MSKTIKIIIVVAAVLIGLYVTGRVTGMLVMYSIPTSSNEPSINPGDRIFSSNLVTPERLKFICYKYNDQMTGKGTWLHRLVGLPGDVIEIRKGNLFVNNERADTMLNLMNDYYVDLKYAQQVQELFKIDEKDDADMRMIYQKDNLIFLLSDEQVKQLAGLQIPVQKMIRPESETDEFITKLYNQPWNIDHFGPYKVPPDYYFVIGDNRHRSQDSRYIGPIPQKDFVGVVLGK